MGTTKKYRGREWMWWVIMNVHVCRFCYEQGYPHGRDTAGLGRQTGLNWMDKKYRSKLYQVWLRHMKEYHPEILKEA